MRVLLLLVVLLGPSLARADSTLTVLAAASLKQPLEAAVPAFERAHPGVHVVISAAATGVLTKQVEAGVPADVLIGASSAQLEPLVTAKLLQATRVIARNRLVLAAPAASKREARSLQALLEPGFARIALGLPRTVPAGAYAEQAMKAAGLLSRLQPRFVYGQSVTQVLTYLKSGDVDAGFVYASDAALAGGRVRVLLVLEDSSHLPIVYPAAVITRSPRPTLAQAWIAFLLGAEGQAALHQAGFLAP